MQVYQDAVQGSELVPLPSERWSTPQASNAPEETLGECEEMLIVDHRADIGPAQLVENKLSSLLGGALPPVSHVRMLAQLGSRTHC